MVPSLPVVQGIEAEPESLEEVDPILWLHDVIPIRLNGEKDNVKSKVKSPAKPNLNVGARSEPQSSFPGAMRLCLSHMLLLRKKTDL